MRNLITFILFLSISTFYLKAQTPLIDASLGKGIQVTASDSSMQTCIKASYIMVYEGDVFLDDTPDWNHNAFFQTLRLDFSGWALNPKFSYQIQLGLAPAEASGIFSADRPNQNSRFILDAYLKWQFHKNHALFIGQKRSPGSRELITSLFKIGLTNRSLLHLRMNLDRDMGIQLASKWGEKVVLKSVLEITKGDGRNILSNNFGGLQYVARLDLLPLGDFKGDFSMTDFNKSSKPKIALGTVVAFNHNTVRSRSVIGNFVVDSTGNFINADILSVFADFILKYQGFTFLGEYVYKTNTKDNVEAIGRFGTGSAINMHLSYLLGQRTELHLRYNPILPDANSSLAEEIAYTLGMSHYIKEHTFKIVGETAFVTYKGIDDLRFIPRLSMQCLF